MPVKLKALAYPEILKKVEADKRAKGVSFSPLSAKTINNKSLAAVSTVCAYTVSNGYIDANPCAGIRVGRKGCVSPHGSPVPRLSSQSHFQPRRPGLVGVGNKKDPLSPEGLIRN